MRLIYIALGWTAGMILAASLPGFMPLVWLFFCVVLSFSVYLSWHSRIYRLLFVSALAFVLGGLRYSLLTSGSQVSLYNGMGGISVEGVIIKDPDVRDDRTEIRVAVDTVHRAGDVDESSGIVLVQIPRETHLRYGDHVIATGLLFRPGEFDTFSYENYLARQNVFSIMEQSAVEVISKNRGNIFQRGIYDLRRQVIDQINQYLPEPQAGLLVGILTGNERNIAPSLEDAFAATGASHIIAISGFNMVIISGVVMSLLKYFAAPRRMAVGIGIGVIVLYTIFAGANGAVIRAALMCSLLIIGQNLGRKSYVPASLAFVALVLSLFNPYVLWDISFQLSFFATLGLSLFVEPLQKGLNTFLQRITSPFMAQMVGGLLAEPFVVTLAAQITTLPLIIFYFQRVSLVAVSVNLLIIPVQAYLLIVGGLATLVSYVLPVAGQILYWIDMLLLSWSIGVVRWFAALPFADSAIYIHDYLIYSFFFMLIGWGMMVAIRPQWWIKIMRFMRNRVVFSAVIFAGGSILTLLIAIFLSRPDGQLHVWFLDVGHSNGVLIETPGGAHILVDGGRFPSRLLTAIGDRLPFYDRELEAIFITQPDEFDTSALSEVLKRYKTGVIVTNGQPNLSDAFAELEAALEGREVVSVTAGYTLELNDGVKIEALHPQHIPTLSDDFNDYPLVLRITYGEVSFLLPGDASPDAQIELLDRGQFPVATVLQLPEHGTSRSLEEDFLSVVQPQVVVIQSDPANRRGDPDPDVLRLLPEEISVLRTDEIGMIHLWTDGLHMWSKGEK